MNQMTEADFQELQTLLEQGEQYNEADEIELVLKNFSDFNAFIYEKVKCLA